MLEIFKYDFMLNAMLASFLASIACGIVGSFIVVKRLSFLSGGVAHSAYGGIGLGYLLNFNPIFGAVGSSIIGAVFIGFMRKQKLQNEDTLIGILWAFGMALGVFFISLSPGYAPDLMSYLFGNILTVSSMDIYFMIALNLIIVFTVVIFFKEFQSVTFDEEFARSIGINVDFYYLLLLILTALTIVLLIKLVGIILVIALLTIPAAISKSYVSNLKNMMFLSMILGLLFTFIGLFFSYYLNLASGSTIIIVAVIGYGLSLLINYIKPR